MKRLLTTTATAVAFGLAATGCGVAAPETAGRVEDTTISFEAVAELAKAEEIVSATQEGLVSAGEGTVGSGSRRTALAQLVQVAAAEEWVQRNDSITDADRAAGAEGRQQSASEAFGELTERYFTVSAALARIAEEMVSGSEDEARANIYNQLGTLIGPSVCLEAAQVGVADADAFAELVGTSNELIDIDPGDLEVTPFTSGEQCFTELSLTGYLDPIRNAPIGSWYQETLTVQGQSVVLFVKVGERGPGGLEDQATVELIDALVTQPQQLVSLLQYAAVLEADIRVDSRLGTWDPAMGGITPPVTPIMPVSNTATDELDIESLLSGI